MTLVGIIGGTGKTGKQFADFFTRHGCTVKVASRRTKTDPVELASLADVVIISVPIRSTLKVIKGIAPHVRKDALFMDVTSLKAEPVKEMLKSKCDNVIGTHPMFGPSIKSLQNQTIVLCPARGKKWISWLKEIFSKENAIIKIATPEEHDKMMSVIQGMMHFSSITFCKTLKDLDIDINEALTYTSPVFKLQLDMTGRILNQDSELYADIELLNPHVKKAVKKYVGAAEKLKEIVLECSESKFKRFFKKSADHLGNFKKQAEEESDYLIKKMANRK